MEINPKKINSSKIEPQEKLEGGNMKKDIRESKNDYYKIEDTRKNVNKNETISAPAMPASMPAPKDLDQATTSSLQSPTELLSEAWELYKSRRKTFLGIMAVPMLFFVISVFIFSGFSIVTMGFLSDSITYSDPFPILILFSVLYLIMIIVWIWSRVVLICAIKNSKEKIGIKELYKRGWHKLKPFFWVLILSELIISGGFILFYIPGIIFSISFVFATFIVITEDLRGMNAILKSVEYVKNYWWSVLWRLLFLFLIMVGIFIGIGLFSIMMIILTGILLSSVGEMANIIGPVLYLSNFILVIVAAISIVPLATIYSFLVYSNLKKVKGDFEFKPSPKIKNVLVVIGLLYFLITIFGMISAFSTIFSTLDNEKNKIVDTAHRSDITQIQMGLSIYYGKEKKYPESLSELDKYYMEKPYEYRQLNNGKDYEVCAFFEEGRECFSSKEETPIDNITERDLQRISDLEFISTMLEDYKTEADSYPLSNVISKLNENNSAVNEIKSANENINIPTDPKNPEYYYGYQSLDGESFELTARLENVDDSRCELEIKESSGICIYKLRN